MAGAGHTIKQVLNAAEQAAKSGDLPRAISLYRQILVKAPKHSKAKKALARLQKQGGGAGQMTQSDAQTLVNVLNTGNFEMAQQAAKDYAQRFPNEPFVFNILGYASGMIGDEKAALDAYKWAIKLNPNFVEAMSNYGSYLLQIGKITQAIDVLKKAVAKKPDYAEAHHNLGVAYYKADQVEAARTHYDRALQIVPKYANALNSRATLHAANGNVGDAIDDLRQALQFAPNDAEVCSTLGGHLARIGQTDEGFELMERAIKMDPTNATLRSDYAVSLTEAGMQDKALVAFRSLLDIEPTHAQAHRLMIDLLPASELPAFADHVEKLKTSETATAMDKVHFGFALGYYYEKAGDVDGCFTNLDLANTTYRSQLPEPPETDAAKFKRIEASFERGVFSHLSNINTSHAPFFVVGMMRSGTSLVEQIISSHSDVYGAGEMSDFTNLSSPVYDKGKAATNADAQYLADEYLRRLTQNSDGAKHCVDKMPGNFFHVGLIKTVFPNAKIVNLVRDPRDNCFSIYKNFFDTYAHQYAYDQNELAQFANSYKSMMNMWDRLFPNAVYHICYEDLVADQEAESRKLLAHLGLEWQDQVLEFHKTKRAVRTASVNQVRQKMYSSSVRSWEPFQKHLKTLLNGLNATLWKDAMRTGEDA